MFEAIEYVNAKGNSRFGKWFAKLDATTAARITRAVRKMEQGNFSTAKAIGGGVFEYWIDAGPGYRIFYGRRGNELIILLAGGTKRGQQKIIDQAKADWSEYKRNQG